MFTFSLLSGCYSTESDTTNDYSASQVTSSNPNLTSIVDISSAVVSTQSSPLTSPEVHVISPDTAKQMMDTLEVIVVDVRREDEYLSGHIERAVLVPNETIQIEAETKLPDKNAIYLIYCRSGRRSNEAAHKLIALGYQNVYDFGGILSWEYGTVS